MLEPWRTGIVTKMEDVTALTRRFWIEIPELEVFNFKPGQFVTLDLPIHEKRNKRWRSYSIASWPDGTNVIELVIVLLEGGIGTMYLFNEVKESCEVLLRGPQGVFVLPAVLDKDLFLICTGTGIAPFRSMLHHIKNNNIAHRNIYLIFGCRNICDSLYGDEMKLLQKELDNFYYIPTYSRETSDDKNIRKGYVHKVYGDIIAQQKPDANFYLCGWKNMIDEAQQRIMQLGYDKKNIHFELYG